MATMMSPDEATARHPLTSPNGTAATRPMALNAETKLALEATALRPLEHPASQLTSVLARLYFFEQAYSGQPLQQTWQRFGSPFQGGSSETFAKALDFVKHGCGL